MKHTHIAIGPIGPKEDKTMGRRVRTENQTIMVMGARNYAKANASDPFAFARCMTHIGNGIATYADNDGKPGYYDATEDKNEYGQRTWRNIARV